MIKSIKEAVEYYWLDDTQAKNDIIAWFEKQSEHASFRNKIQIGDKVTRNEVWKWLNGKTSNTKQLM